MKKTVSLILTFCMVFCMAPAVFAAASVSCSVSSSSVYAGDTFKLTVSAKDVGAVKSIGLTPTYDTQAFEITKTNCLLSGAALAKFDGKNAAIAFSDPVTPSGKIYEFTFKIKDGAKVGSYTFKVSGSFKNDSKGTSVSASGSVKVNIACKHKYGDWKKVSEPTCTAAGSEQRICSLCGNTETRSISAKGHKFGSWSEKTEPTCTKEGTKVRKCTVCGQEEKASIKALGHDLKDPAITQEATCSSHGQATGLCSRCGQIAAVSTPFAAHSFGEWYDKTQADCTAGGIRGHICTVCGAEETAESLPLGHDFSQGEVIREATVYQEGLYEASCTRCGAKGRITTPCFFEDEGSGVKIEPETGIFAEGSQIEIQIPEMSEEEKLYAADFRISAFAESEEVIPGGAYKMSFPIPEDFGRNISICQVAEDGTETEIPCIIDMISRRIEISAEKTGAFRIYDLDSVPVIKPWYENQLLHYGVMGGLACTTLLFLILFLVKKPKKIQTEENSTVNNEDNTGKQE